MLLFFHCPLEPLDATSKPFLCCLRLLEHFNAVTSLIIRLSESCSRSKKLMHQLSEDSSITEKALAFDSSCFPAACFRRLISSCSVLLKVTAS